MDFIQGRAVTFLLNLAMERTVRGGGGGSGGGDEQLHGETESWNTLIAVD